MLAKNVAEFFANKVVFVTGATGLLGKSVIEKLLRSCPNIRAIYVLIRPKRGKAPEERLNRLLESELFDLIRQENPTNLQKIHAIVGDVAEVNFGMSDSDRQLLINEVSVIIHAAATVRFNEPIKLAVNMNLIPVIRLLEIAQQIKNLEILVHVSTAYANCDMEIIEEVIYKPPIDPYKLVEISQTLTGDMLELITPKLLGSKPNTYTFTKQLAEYVVKENINKLPIVIVRPSIIGASVCEPFPGWIDNFNAATGLIAAISKGMLRSMMGDYEKSANIIPVDTAANFIIAVAWYSAGTYKQQLMNGDVQCVNGKTYGELEDEEDDDNQLDVTQKHHNHGDSSAILPLHNNGDNLVNDNYIQVYNYTLDKDTLTWGTFVKALLPRIQYSPSVSCQRLPNFHMTTQAWYHDLKWTFSHMIPAAVLDLGKMLQGQSPTYLRNMDRLKDTIVRLSYFTLNHWHFVNDNKSIVTRAMDESDRKTFNFELCKIDWVSYLNVYHHGTKVYALKERPNTNKSSVSRGKILRLFYFGLRYLSMMLLLLYMMGKMHVFRGIFYQMLRLFVNIVRLMRY